MMRLSEMNKHIVDRCGQGTPHNIGIKTQKILKNVGHELKQNPPGILAHTKKKFGKIKMEKQRKAILLSKARKRGARIPRK